jgi:hypothetical protein
MGDIVITPASNDVNSTAGTLVIRTSDSQAMSLKTNDANRLYITPAGYFGVGTTGPNYPFDLNLGTISTNTNAFGYNVSGNATSNVGYCGYNFQLNNSTANASAYIRLARTSATAYLGLEIASQSRDGIRFLTNSTTPVEVVRIDNLGDVGIGTNNPGSLINSNATYFRPNPSAKFLDLYSETNEADINLISNNSGDGSGIGGIYFTRARGQTDAHLQIAAIKAIQGGTNGTIAGGKLYFYTKSDGGGTLETSPAMAIDTAGNIGIGTTAPASKVQISGVGQTIMRLDSDTLTSVSQFQIKAASQGVLVAGMYGPNPVAGTIFGANTSGAAYLGTTTLGTVHPTLLAIGNTTTIPIIFGTNNTERLRIDPNGYVGLGASSFVYGAANRGLLEIYGSTDSLIALRNATANFYIQKAGNNLAIVNGGAGYLAINNNGADRLLISSVGNVGINTNDPSGKLHVLDASLYAPSLTWNAAAATIIRSENGQIAIGSDSSSPYSIWMQVRTASSTARPMSLNPLGGNVGIGATNPGTKLDIGSTQGGAIQLRYDTSTSYLAQITPYWNSNTDTRIDFAINRIANTTPAVIMSVGYASRVGIGTIAPVSLLDVGGPGSTTAASGLTFGGDAQANLYRAAEDTIKTDGSLNVAGLIYNANSAYYSSVSKSTTANWGQYTVVLGNASYSSQLVQVTVNGGNLVWAGTFLASCHLSYRPNETWINVKLLECATYNCSNDDVTLLALSNSTTSQYGIPALVLKTNGAINGGFGTGYANNIAVTVNGPSPNEFVLSSSSWTQPYTYQIATSANTKQIYTTESGNVGIGITNPSSQANYKFLQVNGTNSAVIETMVGGTRIGGFDSTASALYVGTIGNFPVIFRTQVDEKMRIAANGNVGIGSSNPVVKLEVAGALRVTGIGQIGPVGGYGFGLFNNGTNTFAGQLYGRANGIQFTDNIGGNTVYIASGGNVGIGLTNPSYKLEIAAGTSNTVVAKLTQGNERVRYNGFDLLGYNDGNLWMMGNNATSTILISKDWDWDSQVGIAYTPGTVGVAGGSLEIGQLTKNNASFTHGNTRFYTSGVERLRINNIGNIGIGTNNPGDKLQVNLNSGENILANIIGNGVSANNKVGFKLSELGVALGEFSAVRDGTNYQVKLQTLVNQPLSFGTSGTTRMVIDGSFVGIGSTTPTALLNVRASIPAGIGTTPAGTNVLLDSNASNYITFRNSADNGTYAGLVFLDNNVGGYVAFGNAGAAVGSDSMIYGAYQDHIFQNNYVNETLYNRPETMRIKQNGRVGIGTNTPTTLLSVGGAGSTTAASGITFGGDASANLYRDSSARVRTDGAFISSSYIFAGTYLQTSNGNIFPANFSTDIVLNVGNAAANNWETYPFTLKKGGYVGLGTNSPSGKFHIVSSVAGQTVLRTDGTNGTLFSVIDDLSDSLMSVNNSAGLPVLEVFADDRVVAGQYGSGDFVLINNKVGLGTSNPANKLSVIGAASIGSNSYNVSAPANGLTVEGKVGIGTSSVDSWAQLKVIGTTALGGIVYVTDKIQGLTAFPGSAALLQLNPDGGNVGIGTTSSSYKLRVYDANNTTPLSIEPGANAAFRFAGNSTSAYTTTFNINDTALYIGHDSSVRSFNLQTNSTDRLTIKGDGNVGIGTTNPSQKLDVRGNIKLGADNAGNYIYYVKDTEGTIINTSRSDASQQGLLRSDGWGNFTVDKSIGVGYSLGSSFPSSTIGNGNLYVANTIGINTTSPAEKLDVRGGILRTNSRISNSEGYPLGHYAVGETVFEIDPTWSQAELQKYFNSSNVTWVAVADAPGGYCIYINDLVQVGGFMDSGFPYIPVDTNDIFYMECWIQNVGTNQAHYMGSQDLDQNFGNLGGNPGSYGYWVMSNYNPGTSWIKVTGYIGGFSNTIGQFKAGTKYWTPQALFNYTAGTGTRACRISGWKVIKVYQPGNRFFAGTVGIGLSNSATILGVGGAGSTSAASGITFGADSAANIYRSSTSQLKTDGSFVVTNTLTVGGADLGARVLKNGSDSISSTLYLANAANSRAYNFQPNAAGTNLALWAYNSSNAWINTVNFNYDGNVGIGASPVAARLHIKGDGSNPVLRVETADLQSAAGGTAGKTFVGWLPIMTGALSPADKVFIPLYK